MLFKIMIINLVIYIKFSPEKTKFQQILISSPIELNRLVFTSQLTIHLSCLADISFITFKTAMLHKYINN